MPRGGSTRARANDAPSLFGWSVEQYGLAGFAPLYAGRLHVLRVAAARQVMLWLLAARRALTDAPLTCGDLARGVRGVRRRAHRAARARWGGAAVPRLPHRGRVDGRASRRRSAPGQAEQQWRAAAARRGQAASQYPTEASPGLLANLRCSLRRCRRAASRRPSSSSPPSRFSTRGGERDAFYDGLPLAPPGHPFLLVVIKGVGEAQRRRRTTPGTVCLPGDTLRHRRGSQPARRRGPSVPRPPGGRYGGEGGGGGWWQQQQRRL